MAFTAPLLIRDAILARLKAMPFFAAHDFHYHTNKALQIQPENVPFAGVYLIEETNLPDGDANVAEPRFHCTVRYGVSVIIQNNDAEAAENKLDEAMAAINRIFNDPTLYNWSGLFGAAKIQAYLRGARSHQFGSIGADNELPVAELRYDLTCDLGTFPYAPDVPDEFITMHVETRYPPGASEDVQQVIVQYDILQYDTGARMRGVCKVFANATVQ
jgi:hypothetical protein